jgi:hypothetical protein
VRTQILDAMLLVFVGGLDPLVRLDSAQQRDAAARQDAFFDRGAGCVHRIVDVEGEALATLVVNKLRGGLKVAVKTPGFT